jgi:hypothetical protein
MARAIFPGRSLVCIRFLNGLLQDGLRGPTADRDRRGLRQPPNVPQHQKCLNSAAQRECRYQSPIRVRAHSCPQRVDRRLDPVDPPRPAARLCDDAALKHRLMNHRSQQSLVAYRHRLHLIHQSCHTHIQILHSRAGGCGCQHRLHWRPQPLQGRLREQFGLRREVAVRGTARHARRVRSLLDSGWFSGCNERGGRCEYSASRAQFLSDTALVQPLSRWRLTNSCGHAARIALSFLAQ